MSRQPPTRTVIDLVAGLGDVHQHARLQDLMIKPFAVIVLDDRGKEILGNICGPISVILSFRGSWDRKA